LKTLLFVLLWLGLMAFGLLLSIAFSRPPMLIP
jgi:hypothetical protein